jgi:hypothetical protein
MDARLTMPNAKPMLAVSLVLVGGWMLNIPGAVYLVPVAVFAGIIATGGIRLNLIAALGYGIAAVLLISAADPRAIAFAIMFALMVSAAAISPDVIRRGLGVLLPLGLVTAVGCWAQQAAVGGRAVGLLALNSNATAGFLVVAAVWTLSKPASLRRELLVVLMLTGIAPTGSRWGLLCAVIIITAMAALRHVSPRTAIIVLVPVLVISLVQAALGIGGMARLLTPVEAYEPITRAVTGNQYTPIGQQTVTVASKWDTMQGLTEDFTLGGPVLPLGLLLGNGYQGPGAHNLFMRAFSEAGLLGLGLLLTAIRLGVRYGRTRERWLIATLVLLGMMDLYVWGPFMLAPLLWMACGASYRPQPLPTEVQR